MDRTTSIAPWRPFDSGLDGLLRPFGLPLLDDIFPVARTWSAPAATFPVNVTEHRDRFEIAAMLPGMTEEQIKVTCTPDRLTIAVTETAPSSAEGTVHVSEFAYAHSERSRAFTFRQAVDPDKVEAKLDRGVLTVTLAKSAATQAREIKVGSVVAETGAA